MTRQQHSVEGFDHVAFSAGEPFLTTLADRLTADDVDFRETETSLYFADPDGNALEVTSWRKTRLRSGRDHW